VLGVDGIVRGAGKRKAGLSLWTRGERRVPRSTVQRVHLSYGGSKRQSITLKLSRWFSLRVDVATLEPYGRYYVGRWVSLLVEQYFDQRYSSARKFMLHID
jgi:hypothetical protein